MIRNSRCRHLASTISAAGNVVWYEDLRANLNSLQELIYFFIRHLLPQLREYVSKFTSSDEAITLFVKYLETTDKFLCRRVDQH